MQYILVVDDNEDGREPLCAYLQKSGYDIDCVSNGREALEAILARLPDLVILDLIMPEMDGPSLLEVLRSYLRLQSLPVVVMTGLADGLPVDRARHLKVSAILVKGKATLEDVLHAVQRELPQLAN